jgi:protoporphyrinogen oxidase
MRTEQVHTVILGAGPSGLTAGYVLAKAGHKPLILERDKQCGGLMRSVRRGDFTVDIGRKELYNRLERVDEFWHKLLGDEYRLYPHRGGLLYDGQIFDLSPAYRGFRRGMPWSTFLGCSFDFLWQRLKPFKAPARTVQEYFYQTRGRKLTQVVSQGFQEKLTGQKWSEISLGESSGNGADASFFKTIKGALTRTFSAKEPNTYKGIWKHPARGTGQICEYLEKGMVEAGGRVQCGAKLLGFETADNSRVTAVLAEVNGETVKYEVQNVISSIPLEFLIPMLSPGNKLTEEFKNRPSPFRKKTVILVYLFLNEEPHFPHAWLNVTCPQTRIGRITNYSSLNGHMVPEGKTCLCCEFYCFDEDPFLNQSDKQIADLAISECSKFGLLDPSKCFDQLVIRLPGADASQNRHNWLSKIRLGLLEEVKSFKNLYYVNRTDLDIATLAGIDSAEAIISGNRSTFDLHIDPRQIGIRSERKAFEFKNPASQN